LAAYCYSFLWAVDREKMRGRAQARHQRRGGLDKIGSLWLIENEPDHYFSGSLSIEADCSFEIEPISLIDRLANAMTWAKQIIDY
jgi:hypothetical protein